MPVLDLIVEFVVGDLPGVGAIALLVAAIGIANTMTMSILERTREIGLMKAVGATNRDVLAIFLGEAVGIGFLGRLGGVISGWLAGQAINVVAIVYLAGQASQQGGVPPSVAVYTPVWLPIFALVFSTHHRDGFRFVSRLACCHHDPRAGAQIYE